MADDEKKVYDVGEEEYLKCEERLHQLNNELMELRAFDADADLEDGAECVTNKFYAAAKSIESNKHLDGKISAIAWNKSKTFPKGSSECDNQIATIEQNGRIIVHDPQGTMLWFRQIDCAWYMTGQFSPDGSIFAAGGLDNVLTLHKYHDSEFTAVKKGDAKVLEKHGGYLGAIDYQDNEHILTGGGDTTIMRWDLTKSVGTDKEPLETFIGHRKDVSSIKNLDDPNMFLSASEDGYAKLWDIRVPHGNGCVSTFAHSSDPSEGVEDGDKMIRVGGINDMKLINQTCFVTAGQGESADGDGIAKVWDLRAQNSLRTVSGFSEVMQSCAVSTSGRMLYVGGDRGSIAAYDLLKNEEGPVTMMEDELQGLVCGMEVSPNGDAVAACSLSKEIGSNFRLFVRD